MQISKISYNQTNYPDSLRQITYPPQDLYILGKLPTMPTVAIIGSRYPTSYGQQITYQLSSQLAAAGVAIASGIAYGIDAVALQAAVDSGGSTIAVLAGGLDEISPAGNRGLAQKMLQSGALVSEYPPGIRPRKQNFVARNRIVSGLSRAVIVTEANASSGAMITVNYALEQGRLVMAVPGNITSLRSAGPNNLIKTGAIPVTDVSDILSALDLEGLSAQPVKADSREEAKLLELLQQGFNSSEALIEQSGFSASQFANIISLMEISGKVRNLGAGQWVSR